MAGRPALSSQRRSLRGGDDPRASAEAVDPANQARAAAAGKAWADRLKDDKGPHVAIFYICGHGVAVPTRSLVFLEDLAGLDDSPWAPFIDVQLMGSTLQRVDAIKSAFLFVDACQEMIDAISLAFADNAAHPGQGLRFFRPDRYDSAAAKVLLLAPGSMGSLTFDDGNGGGGRYTHILIEALSGAAARETSGVGTWSIFTDGLPQAMKRLYALRWSDGKLAPTKLLSPDDEPLLVQFNGTRPRVPVRIRFDPPVAIRQADKIWLGDPAGAEIAARTAVSAADTWLERVEVRQGLCTVNASFTPGAPYTSTPQPIDLSEMRVEPIIVHRVIP